MLERVKSGAINPDDAVRKWGAAVGAFDGGHDLKVSTEAVVETARSLGEQVVRCESVRYVRKLAPALSTASFSMEVVPDEQPPDELSGWAPFRVVECGQSGLEVSGTSLRVKAGETVYAEATHVDEDDALELWRADRIFLDVAVVRDATVHKGRIRRVRRAWEGEQCRFLVVPAACLRRHQVVGSFGEKKARFERGLESLRVPWSTGHTTIEVPREGIGSALLEATQRLSVAQFRQTWRFKIKGEAARDDGGVAREVWTLASAQLFAANDYFRYAATDKVTIQIKPDSYDKKALGGLGRLAAKALLDGQTIAAYFNRPLLKHILALPVDFADLEYVDAALHHSCIAVLHTDGAADLGLVFEHRDRDAKTATALVANGSDVSVTDHNKDEFVARLFKFAMLDQIAKPLAAFLGGFYSVVPLDTLQGLDAGDLELLISGLATIDCTDWKKHTVLSGGLYKSAPVVAYFWDYVRNLDDARRAKLLQFATGTTRLPPGGFKDLQGRDGETQRFTLHGIPFTSDLDLPRAHTCFNKLDLPKFPTKDRLHLAFDGILASDVTFFSAA